MRLWIFALITFFSAFQLFPAIPLHILSLGGTKSQAGLFLAFYTYACAFSAPLTGSVADTMGRRKALIVASTLFVAFSLLYGVVHYWPLLLAVACIHGVCWSAVLSSSAAIISEIVPESRRTEGIAYYGMASTAAIAVAPAIGLAVYRHHGWPLLCVEMAALSVVMIFLALMVHDTPRPKGARLPGIKEIVDWRVVAAALTLFVVSFSYGGITSYVAILASERHIIPSSLFFSIFAVTILVTRVFTAPIGDRIGARALLLPSLGIVPIALVVLAFAESRAGIIAAAIVYGTGFGGAYPAFTTFVLGHADPERRAATFGSVLWAFDTGIGSGSLALGLLVQHFGFTTAFLTAAGVSLLSLPIFALTAGLLHRRSEATAG